MLNLIAAVLSWALGTDVNVTYVSPTVALFSLKAGWLLFHMRAARQEDWSGMLLHLPEDIEYDPGLTEDVGNGWECAFIEGAVDPMRSDFRLMSAS